MTIYNLIYKGKLRASRLSSRMTIIVKDDIMSMLQESGYTKIPKEQDAPITDLYTTSEILEKFGISESWLYKAAKTERFPKVFQMGKSYWSKKHIDAYFEKKRTEESITEWYTVAEVMVKFNMTVSAVYTFVSKFGIPKKKLKKEVLYSKHHVDVAKGIAEPEVPKYYTVKEAMEKFNVTRDQLYHYVKARNIPKVQEGKYVKISKKELDELFAPPTIG